MTTKKSITVLFFCACASVTLFIAGCGSDGTSNYATVSGTVSGSGTISGLGKYVIGTTAQLMAVPFSGWQFTRWEGDISGSTNPISFTVTGSTSVKAIFTEGSGGNTPKAVDMNITCYFNQSVDIHLQSTNTTGDNLTYTVVSNPTKGSLSGANDNLTYTPTAGYLGKDSFTYKVTDTNGSSAPATVQITVTTFSAEGWAKSIGGSLSDGLNSMTTDTTGNVYLTGYFSGTVNFGSGSNGVLTSNGKKDMFVAKYSGDGTLLWAKQIGGTDDDEGRGITLDSFSNVYVVGNVSGAVTTEIGSFTGKGSTDIIVAKFNSSGTMQWAKVIGGTTADNGNCIAMYQGGYIYYGGSFSGQVNFSTQSGTDSQTASGTSDGFISKLDASNGNYYGTLVWSSTGKDEITGLGTDVSGSVYVGGNFASTLDLNPTSGIDSKISKGSSDIFLVKLNSSASYLWGKIIGSGGDDKLTSLYTNASGITAIGGTFQGTVEFNPDSSSADTHTSSGGNDGFVIVFNPNGIYTWGKDFGGISTDEVHSVAMDSVNSVYLGGAFSGTVNFDFTSGQTDSKTSAGLTDGFLTKLNSSGQYDYTLTVGGSDMDKTTAVAATQNTQSVFWGGNFKNTVDLDPQSSSQENHSSFGMEDIFLIKMKWDGTW